MDIFRYHWFVIKTNGVIRLMAFTEKDITGAVARNIRLELKLSQSAFWKPLGVQQSVGARYEGEYNEIPQAVRILIVANYISGLKIDALTTDGVKELKALGKIQSSFQRATDVADTLRGTLDEAAKQISEVRKTLARL